MAYISLRVCNIVAIILYVMLCCTILCYLVPFFNLERISFLSPFFISSSMLAYFKTDLHVGHSDNFNRVGSPLCEKGTVVSEALLKKTVDQLIYGPRDGEVKFLMCQAEACVLQKSE